MPRRGARHDARSVHILHHGFRQRERSRGHRAHDVGHGEFPFSGLAVAFLVLMSIAAFTSVKVVWGKKGKEAIEAVEEGDQAIEVDQPKPEP